MLRHSSTDAPGTTPEEPSSAASEAEAPVPSENPEVAALKQQLDETYARYQRAVADLENARRRGRQELAERTQYANEQLVLKLLPLLDNFQRALANAPEGIDPNWFDGVRLIARPVSYTHLTLPTKA